MPTTLLDELRQRKPFASLAEEAHLNLSRTEAVLQEGQLRTLIRLATLTRHPG